ncbi:S-adenosyl-L-methionine-dependent methyltransferase [Massarina eburnea CBS 473.64]|uniref:S-adenosyl-L-methionine-dependent methyltransferase n=1 Tax=Massarina eburnea CBS 473.64 TaxID=1395130 RepID=A0A6A6S3A0_9PLEO|nr:S-adenosyl-L-methionine-dependent methyltransferase [Massarina eburnea CBS 473.64]
MCASGANELSDTGNTTNSSVPSPEVDSDDRDSAIGDNQSSYTVSATSSVYKFKYENGRRYHAYSEGKYPIPNDEVEADRLDLQHQAFRLTLDGRLYSAPIPKDVQNVLDVGCGTGIWTIEFADEHPSATVIGTDLSPIQPTSVPPNCSFLIDDLDQNWIFHSPFDYIHSRALVAAVKDWGRFFEQAYTNLKPGGYLECQEPAFPIHCMDTSLTIDQSPILRWSQLFIDAAAVTGLDATAPNDFASKLRAAGFVDIRTKNYKWPVGTWGMGKKMKLLGYFANEDFKDWLPSAALGLFTRVLKWSREEVEVFLSECRRERREQRGRHFYANVLFWVARKPEDAELANPSIGQEFVRTEVDLKADDAVQGSSNQEDPSTQSGAQGPSNEAGSEQHSKPSPSILVVPTADLSMQSPLQKPVIDASPSFARTASSESQKPSLSTEEMLNPALTAVIQDKNLCLGAIQSGLVSATTAGAVGLEAEDVAGEVSALATRDDKDAT